MGKNNQLFSAILPVMFGFFIMGFVDLVGISTNYVKDDLGMSDSMVSLISVSCFIWFFLLSIPTGFLMNRFGRKLLFPIYAGITLLATLWLYMFAIFGTIRKTA